MPLTFLGKYSFQGHTIQSLLYNESVSWRFLGFYERQYRFFVVVDKTVKVEMYLITHDHYCIISSMVRDKGIFVQQLMYGVLVVKEFRNDQIPREVVGISK